MIPTRRRHLGLAFLLVLGFMACALSVQADDLMWNGFLTTGTAFSNRATPYIDGIAKEPALASQSHLGLNLAKDVSPSVRVAAQLLIREDEADAAVKADWAFVSFRIADRLHLTLGKQKVPMWIASAYVDVGAAYPWARPPEEVYSLFNLKSFNGTSFRYEQPIGPSVLVIEPYGGETFVETQPSQPTADSKLTGRNLFGASVDWTWGVTTLRASYNRALWTLNLGDGIQLGERHMIIRSFGFSTELSDFFLMAEYGETIDLDENKFLSKSSKLATDAAVAAAAGDKVAAATLAGQSALLGLRVGGARGQYVTVGRKFDEFTVHITGASLQHLVTPGVTQDQRSAALGTSYDLSNDSVLKLEAKRIFIPHGSVGLFKSAVWTSELDDAMIYSINYNLIF